MRRKRKGPKVEIDFERHEVYIDNKYLFLPRKEFKILKVLHDANGRIVPSKKILKIAWDYTDREVGFFSKSRKVDTHIYSIRLKFERTKRGSSKSIVNIKTRGYKLVR